MTRAATDSMSHRMKARAPGFALAAMLHAAALGLLMLQPPPRGAPDRLAGQDRGPVVVAALVRLAPSPAAGGERTSGHEQVRPDDPRAGMERPADAPPAPPNLAAAARSVRPATAKADGGGRAQPVDLEPNQTPAMTDSSVMLYRSALEAHLARYRRYPTDARRDHVEGTVLLHFVLESDGRVVDAWIAQSSGSALLDDEALSAIARAQPLPAIPIGWPERLDVTLPIAFALG